LAAGRFVLFAVTLSAGVAVLGALLFAAVIVVPLELVIGPPADDYLSTIWVIIAVAVVPMMVEESIPTITKGISN